MVQQRANHLLRWTFVNAKKPEDVNFESTTGAASLAGREEMQRYALQHLTACNSMLAISGCEAMPRVHTSDA